MFYVTFEIFLSAAAPLQLEDWGRVLIVSIPLLAAIFALMAVLHYARRQVREQPPTKDELLAQFREAHEAGEIDDAEFRRVTDLLVGASKPRRTDLVRKPGGAEEPGRSAEAESPRPAKSDEGPPAGAAGS